MCRLFPTRICGVSRKCVIEGFPKNVLRVLRKQAPQILRELVVADVRHGVNKLSRAASQAASSLTAG